jgi:peptide/nickel transport system substrate-binding protein
MKRHCLFRRVWFKRVTLATAVIAAAATLAACGGGSSGGGGGNGASGTVTGFFTSAPYVADFNPFSPGYIAAVTNGMVYEPLMFFDTAQSGNVQPWLATGYSWGSGGKSITFALRHNVTWNDGKPFTSSDVAFTFNLEKSSSALNAYGLPISNVTTNGPYSVTINFSQAVYTDLYYIAGKTMILPQHVWSTIKNLTTWTDPKPVGTGAYMVQKVSPQVLTVTANPHYYMPGLPKVKTYDFVVYTSNNTADAAIESGQTDWSGGFIPNINQTYLSKNSKYHLVDIPLSVDYLIPNMVKGPTTSLALRQAVSASLDRNYMSQTVYNGYAPPTNPEGLLLPDYKNVASPATLSDTFGGADPAKARQLLQAAGYTMGSNGYFEKNGQELTVDIKVVSGFTDYLSLLQIIQPELKAAGINTTITQEAYSVWTSDQFTGNFQFLMSNAGYTPVPYSFYYNLLDSAVAKPIGTAETIGNFGRYHNPTVDSLLNQIAATTNTSVQNQAFYQIESIFKQQLPDIPLMEAQDEVEFNGNTVTNFPTTSNPWAGAATWLNPDCGWVASHLAPVK